jgi:hypothetical protein
MQSKGFSTRNRKTMSTKNLGPELKSKEAVLSAMTATHKQLDISRNYVSRFNVEKSKSRDMSEPTKQIFNLNIKTVAPSPPKNNKERRGLQHFKIFNQQRREIKSIDRQQPTQAMDTNSESTS